MSFTSPLSTPACAAAPTATASSGLTPLSGSLPVSSRTRSLTAGMRVEPPTRITRSISSFVSPASRMACSNGPRHDFEQIGGELLELGARQREIEVQRALGGRGDEGQVDVGLLQRRQLDLRLLPGLLEALHGHLVGREVDAVRVLELAHQPVDDALVPVVAAEVGVARGRLHLEHALAEVEDRHVERAAAEVEDEDGLVVVLVEAVGERGRGGLVDDAQHLEAGDLARLLGGLALGVAEVRGHGDHGLGDAVAQVGLGVALELLQRAGRDLLRVVGLAVDVDRPVGAHVALHRTDGAVGVGDGLALGHLAHEHLARLRERDDRRGGAGTLGVGDDDRLAGLEDGDDGVGGAEVDTDGLGHGDCLQSGVDRWTGGGRKGLGRFSRPGSDRP